MYKMQWVHRVPFNLLCAGGVYTCGEGSGILGHEDTGIKTVPKRVEGLRVRILVWSFAASLFN